MNRLWTASLSLLLGLGWVLPAPAAEPAPKKLSASAIQITLVEAGDVRIPAEFRYAIYERLIERVRQSGTFQKVFRSGEREADGVPDMVTLHATIQGFKEGSQLKRELTTVLGATTVDVTATVTARDGHTMLERKVTGKVRFFGENLGATNDLAKKISKLLHESF